MLFVGEGLLFCDFFLLWTVAFGEGASEWCREKRGGWMMEQQKDEETKE